jgi:hypothetical protein
VHVKNPEPRPGEIHPFDSWQELDAIADEMTVASGVLVIFLAGTGSGLRGLWRRVARR